MSTTRVDGRRRPLQALEKYPDAAFVTDNLPLYFGTDGDIKIVYVAASDIFVLTGISDVRPTGRAGTIFSSDGFLKIK